MFIAVYIYDHFERTQVTKYLKNPSFVQEATDFSSIHRLIDYLQKNKTNIVLLDMDTQNVDGIKTAHMIRSLDPNVHIIFTTEHSHYYETAYKLYVTDYLLKPLDVSRLKSTIKRIYEAYNKGSDKLLELKTQNNIYRVKESSIILIEKQLNRCMIYTHHSTLNMIMPLKYFEDILDPSKFIRSHSGYLVNIDEIEKIEMNGNLSYTIYIHSIDKTALISRGKKDHFFEHFSYSSIMC